MADGFSNDGYERAELEKSSAAPSKGLIIGLVLLVVVLILGLGAGVFFLVQPGAPTETIRDVVIIVVAFEFMVIGLALVVLIVQLARLVNLLQNEVRPIIDSASEAARTLRGTARFLSDNLVAPVVKVNAAMAAARRALDMFNFGRRR